MHKMILRSRAKSEEFEPNVNQVLEMCDIGKLLVST